MGKFSYSILALAGIVFFSSQAPVPGNLAESAKKLQEAGTFSATFTVQPIGGASIAYQLKYSKPDLYRLDTPDGFTLCDGQNVYVYKKATNEYTATPVSEATAIQASSAEEVWGWLAFFSKEPFKGFKSASAGGQRNLKGNPVSEVNVTYGGDGKNSATLFIDQKLGLVRGFTLKAGEKDLLVVATALELGKEPMSAASFAFVEPLGSKKTEPPKVETVPFKKVQAIIEENCMPCHGPGMRSGGVDLSTYEGIAAAVRPGAPDRSKIVRSITTMGPNRMPQGRGPLSDADIKAIKDWITGGAKNE